MSAAFDKAVRKLSDEVSYGNLLNYVFSTQFSYKRSDAGNKAGHEDPLVLLEQIFGWITFCVSKDRRKIRQMWQQVPPPVQTRFCAFMRDLIHKGCLSARMINRWENFRAR